MFSVWHKKNTKCEATLQICNFTTHGNITTYRSTHVRWQILGSNECLDLISGCKPELADCLWTQPWLHNLPCRWKEDTCFIQSGSDHHPDVTNRNNNIQHYAGWYKRAGSVSPFMIQGISTMIILAEMEKKRKSLSINIMLKIQRFDFWVDVVTINELMALNIYYIFIYL